MHGLKRSYRATIGLSALLIFLVSGCGQSVTAAAGPIVFVNRTSQMRVQPDASLDPTRAVGIDERQIPVLNDRGTRVYLDAFRGPILFVAYWCPHCQRTLLLLTNHRRNLRQIPTLVFVGYPPQTTFAEARQVVREEHRALHLANFPTFYALSQTAGDTYAPKGYPTLAYPTETGVDLLFGEHTLSIWQKVLGN